jgi:hypothetical protein
MHGYGRIEAQILQANTRSGTVQDVCIVGVLVAQQTHEKGLAGAKIHTRMV